MTEDRETYRQEVPTLCHKLGTSAPDHTAAFPQSARCVLCGAPVLQVPTQYGGGMICLDLRPLKLFRIVVVRHRGEPVGQATALAGYPEHGPLCRPQG